jgi:hypothetical protein
MRQNDDKLYSQSREAEMDPIAITIVVVQQTIGCEVVKPASRMPPPVTRGGEPG